MTLPNKQQRKSTNSNQLQKNLTKLWIEHYTKPHDLETRIEMAKAFMLENYVTQENIGQSVIHPELAHGKHGKTNKKETSATLGEVLSDFITHPTAVKDKTDVQTFTARHERRKEKEEEYGYISIDTSDKQIENYLYGNGAYTESPEEIILTEENEKEAGSTKEQIKQLQNEIKRIKKNAKNTAKFLSEKYEKSEDKLYRNIRNLKPENVKVCEECKEVFYATDRRIKTCSSSCEVVRNKRYHSLYNEEKRS